ncbi:DUF3558 domain-containing protein [Amycolatopsis pretoriensis]|uniref:DUF3558 domain-containing protein n=1 Tax=Amycolatopsis pretoriensis TaxID=218821 RepID=UPI000A376E8E|nr:DUF3558 domain-containing protein [Amycolatopsis pretoriensis]
MSLVACSPQTSGKASPVNTPSSTGGPGTEQQVPGSGVPKVDTPIDTSRFESAPCSALTDAQVTELFGGQSTAKPELQAPAGPTCGWTPADLTGANINVIFSTVDRLGLTSVYQAKGTTYKLFEVLAPIAGHPAVAYGTSDFRATGVCSIAVGTSDRSTVDITVTQSRGNVGKSDPCVAAQTVGSKVLATLLEGS